MNDKKSTIGFFMILYYKIFYELFGSFERIQAWISCPYPSRGSIFIYANHEMV